MDTALLHIVLLRYSCFGRWTRVQQRLLYTYSIWCNGRLSGSDRGGSQSLRVQPLVVVLGDLLRTYSTDWINRLQNFPRTFHNGLLSPLYSRIKMRRGDVYSEYTCIQTFAGNLKATTFFSKLTEYGLAAALFWRAFQLRCSCSLTVYGQANDVNILLPRHCPCNRCCDIGCNHIHCDNYIHIV